jgi:hypothetical protein
MATTPTLNTDKGAPVYLSFKTFQSAVQSLRTHGLPDKLDRTAWQSRSGSEQSQIISGFKFLRLIDENELTQPSLRKLADTVENSKEEKQVLGDILRDRYDGVFALNLKTATPLQLADVIGAYGATRSTRDRAVRFFIKAASYCDVEMSPRLTRGLRARSESSTTKVSENAESTSTAPLATRRRRRHSNAELPERQVERSSGESVKTIKLRNVEGELTLSGTFNPFELDGNERKLVYDIIDLMKAYEQTETAS